MASGDWLTVPPDAKPDVPIERDSIGAMGLSDPAAPPFRAYVYRGTGEDQHPEWDISLPGKHVVKIEKPKAITPEVYRQREVARIKYAAKKARQQRAARDRQVRLGLVETVRTVLDPPRLDIEDPTTWGHRLPRPEIGDEPEPSVPRFKRKPIRSALGWKPLTGADLEHLLDD